MASAVSRVWRRPEGGPARRPVIALTAPSWLPLSVLGLPAGVTACLFDLEGVLTQTAKVHAAARKQMFDHYLRLRAARTGQAFVPFDAVRDYDE